MSILGNWDQNTNPYGISKVPRSNGRHFFGKRHESNKQVPAIFGRFRTRRIFYHPQNGQNPQIKISKIRFFKMSPKMI